MQEIIVKIITNILTALYQPFWFSVLMAMLVMFVVRLYPSFTAAAKDWIRWFRTEKLFRRQFFLAFYTVMILFRTLLNRNMWANPLSNVWGLWGLYKLTNGEWTLTTEVPENLALFIPFMILLLWCDENDRMKTHGSLFRSAWCGIKVTFLFSMAIEMLQLFLRLGTWQLSDLYFNTLGGLIGAVVFWLCGGWRRKKMWKKQKNSNAVE